MEMLQIVDSEMKFNKSFFKMADFNIVLQEMRFS